MITLTTCLRRDYVKRGGKSLVIIRFWINKERIELQTRVDIQAKHWDPNKKIVRKGEKNAKDLNLLIQQSKDRINKILIKYRLSEIELTSWRGSLKNFLLILQGF